MSVCAKHCWERRRPRRHAGCRHAGCQRAQFRRAALGARGFRPAWQSGDIGGQQMEGGCPHPPRGRVATLTRVASASHKYTRIYVAKLPRGSRGRSPSRSRPPFAAQCAKLEGERPREPRGSLATLRMCVFLRNSHNTRHCRNPAARRARRARPTCASRQTNANAIPCKYSSLFTGHRTSTKYF